MKLKRFVSAVSVLAVVSFGLVVGAPAARAEEVVFGCNTEIYDAGIYVLGADVGSQASPCITPWGILLGASDIVLDLNGHTIWGNGKQANDDSATWGVYVTNAATGLADNAVVKGGTVTGFSTGVLLESVNNATVTAMNLHDNIGPDNSNIYKDGIHTYGGGGHVIRGNTVVSNGPRGGITIGRSGEASNSNTIEANVVRNNTGDGITILDGTGNTVRFNKAFGNTAFDLNDTNVAPPCDSDVWKANTYGTRNDPCIQSSRAEVADFNGDGNTDISVFRPSEGVWYVNGVANTAWGTSTDIPVPADYDGDGDADLAVFRPSEGVWYVNGGATVAWGTNGDIPVPGDYNRDGTTEIAVFRPSVGVWFVLGGPTIAYGTSGDIPVPGDHQGRGGTDIAIYRPSIGLWAVANSTILVTYGVAGDMPVTGDYDGDIKFDLAVFRPGAQATWFVHNSSTVTDAITGWGTSDDIPLPVPAAIRLAQLP